MTENNFEGIWMYVKDNDYYGAPRFIVFENHKAVQFVIETEKEGILLLKKNGISQDMSDMKYEFINDRLRIFVKGIRYSVYHDNKNSSEETEIGEDYIRLEPTESFLTNEEIQNHSYVARWDKEKLLIIFNKTLGSEIIQQVNLKMNNAGRKIILEQFEETLFLSFLDNNQREMLLPIKMIDSEKIVLKGFPVEPYEIIGTRLDS